MRFAKIIAALFGFGIFGYAIWLMVEDGGQGEVLEEEISVLIRQFQKGVKVLEETETEAEQRLLLEQMSTFLRLQNREAVRQWLIFWLREGTDVSLAMQFKPGSGEPLSGWPSLRVFLLDWLYGFDPVAAAEVSREVLQESDSPDEWAISLRNLGALGEPGDRELMESKTAELVRNEAWAADPTAGFLEAFDVVVFLRQDELVPDLAGFLDGGAPRAVEFASILTLNRMVEREPVRTLDYFLASPDALEAYPEAKAELFARADVGSPDGAERVRLFLLSDRTSAQERDHFFQTFPHRGQFISNNLLTESATPSGVELAERDAIALARIKEWQMDPAFRNLRPDLFQLEQRLAGE